MKNNALAQALADVRNKLALYQGKELNEQNTKTALIDPVLRALGWNVGNLDEVSQEYKRQTKDKPVDYALFLLRTPKVFVEAKAFRQTLDDRKWANQIMGYAAVAGVKWTVITNGDEYRIFNACVEVPIEEKLFRSIGVTSPGIAAEETLALLSKDRIRDNDIEVLWKAHFVDRQVRNALEELFSADNDPSLIRLVRKRVRELSAKDIRASLARMRLRFDFPIDTDSQKVDRATLGKRPRTAQTRQFVVVKLNHIIEAGLVSTPLELTRKYKGKLMKANLQDDGSVLFEGKRFKTCSAAGEAARHTVTGRQMNTNGWRFWQYRDKSDKLVFLDTVRRTYLKQMQK